jgi:transposase InsO family protein
VIGWARLAKVPAAKPLECQTRGWPIICVRKLALSALDMAIGQRYVTPGALVHHSDQGVQYACGDYIARLERAGIRPSMSRAG